ncbi:hypothetical protein PYW07_011914 [Mythimna separata]|uniref:Uncharacterized protein n=1 Tax=Mythimna separata TaxID=271217 RepID=A0AAD8DKU5_MYTSE|nr:hypothetical protein PYW07_011914 [Mythimna separata]
MASDSAKRQLSAIYKLEFYKNKKNWKLYEDVRKEPPSPQTPHKLDKTYSVGEDFPKTLFEDEQDSPHNKAFLHEVSDDTPDPQPPDSDRSLVPESNLYRARSWPGQPCSGDRLDAQQDWCGAEAEGIPEGLGYDQCDGPWQQGHLWTPASDFSLKPAVDTLDLHPEYLTPAQMLATAEEWLLLHGYPLLQQEYASSYEEYGLTPAQMLRSGCCCTAIHCCSRNAEEWLLLHGYPLLQQEYASSYEEYGVSAGCTKIYFVADSCTDAEEWLLLHGYPLLQQEYASSYEEYGLTPAQMLRSGCCCTAIHCCSRNAEEWLLLHGYPLLQQEYASSYEEYGVSAGCTKIYFVADSCTDAEEWLLLHGYPLLQQEYASSYEEYGLLDESVDFVRGAHQAPHSSEIDLSITKECLCPCKDSVYLLSMRQLTRAVRHHHAALALLLHEQALRDRLNALSRTTPPLPYEECPTRDTDPLLPPDAVLAASHAPHVTHALHASHDIGRGRGRLLQARRLLGLGPDIPGQL